MSKQRFKISINRIIKCELVASEEHRMISSISQIQNGFDGSKVSMLKILWICVSLSDCAKYENYTSQTSISTTSRLVFSGTTGIIQCFISILFSWPLHSSIFMISGNLQKSRIVSVKSSDET